MKPDDNPFDRFDIDPLLGARGITERMRDLAEEADEASRAEIRAAWEELTLHPARRLRAALGAHPETRPPLGAPPAPPPRAVDPELSVEDLALRPSVALALEGDPAPPPPDASGGGSLEDDPILARIIDVR